MQARLARLLRDGEAALAETGATLRFDVRLMAGVDPNVDASVAGRTGEGGPLQAAVGDPDRHAAASKPPRRHSRARRTTFFARFARRQRLPPKALSRPALSLIAALPWRGNAIELQLMLESIVAGLSGGKGIGIEDVLAHVRLDAGAVVFGNGGTLRQARARFESEYIAHVVAQHHGRISRGGEGARHPANEPVQEDAVAPGQRRPETGLILSQIDTLDAIGESADIIVGSSNRRT